VGEEIHLTPSPSSSTADRPEGEGSGARSWFGEVK